MKNCNNLLFAFIVCAFSTLYAENDVRPIAGQVEKTLGVKILYDRKVEDTWKGSKYDLPSDMVQLKKYLLLLEMEFGKYPAGYMAKAGAGTIVLTEKYYMQGNHQAAMPDPYGNRLYLAIDGAYGIKTETYLVHVMHHELHHCTEYAIWRNQYYKWDEWAALNTPGFVYGRGGLSAYRDSSRDYYSLTNPVPGFVNFYSTTGQEEDRSEIFSVMMSDIERPILHRICKKDPIVKEKVKKMIGLINNFAGVSGEKSYWEKKNITQ